MRRARQAPRAQPVLAAAGCVRVGSPPALRPQQMRSPPARGCSWMTVDSSMSSGYCSLEDDLEDCFFTAKTTFFRNVQSKQPPKNVCKPAEETPHLPTLQEIKQKIDSYNTREKYCLGMKLSEDGSYTGFIKVHLKLRRPVTVPAGIRPQSIYDAIKEVNLAATTDKRTSFYLPLDAIKQLHISSTTTVSEVIQGLLKKFMVVDNPQKFALFKRMHKDGQVLFQKLSIADRPLYLRLLAGPDTDVLSFVLKENETGEVEWDAFSIPELQNFLTILEKEEQDKIQQVQKKYDKFRQKLEAALRESQGKPG